MNSVTMRPHLQQLDVRHEQHPARQEIQRCLGIYNLQAIVEEDINTSALMRHIPGLIAFVCTLKSKDKVIAQGYGSSILGPNNRYVSRAVTSAANSAVADSIIRATKVLGTLQDDAVVEMDAIAPSEPITEPQKRYLAELAIQHITDETEREEFMSEMPELTKQEASKLIQQFKS